MFILLFKIYASFHCTNLAFTTRSPLVKEERKEFETGSKIEAAKLEFEKNNFLTNQSEPIVDMSFGLGPT